MAIKSFMIYKDKLIINNEEHVVPEEVLSLIRNMAATCDKYVIENFPVKAGEVVN